MDDKEFDKQSAHDWSQLIESQKVSLRDEDIYPRLNDWLEQSNSKLVLDVGCGQGICSDKLDFRNREYYGVDPSPYLIKRAVELYPKISTSFNLGNIYNLPFDNDKFDSIFSIAVWHLLEKLDQASHEVARVLQGNGKFLIITANPEFFNEWTAAYDKVEIDGAKVTGSKATTSSLETEDTIYLYPIEKIKQSLSKSNLIVTKVESIRIWTLIEGFKK